MENPIDEGPRTRGDEFPRASEETAKGNGAVWWGTGALIAATAAIFLVFEQNWIWAIIVGGFAAWQLWLTKEAIRRRNF
jgi:hypothetical protein